MTQEEKRLLLKDICGRLPYGVKFACNKNVYIAKGLDLIVTDEGNWEYAITAKGIVPIEIDFIKPYLRPMSSMTEEEIEEYRNLSDEVIGSYGPYHHEFIAHCVRLGIKPDNPHECVDDFLNMEAIDWLIEHHFDYRGLIPMGLALEAPEGMYDETLV